MMNNVALPAKKKYVNHVQAWAEQCASSGSSSNSCSSSSSSGSSSSSEGMAANGDASEDTGLGEDGAAATAPATTAAAAAAGGSSRAQKGYYGGANKPILWASVAKMVPGRYSLIDNCPTLSSSSSSLLVSYRLPPLPYVPPPLYPLPHPNPTPCP